MPNDSKLYLCFEYCDYDLKKYMKSCQYKLSANCIKVGCSPFPAAWTTAAGATAAPSDRLTRSLCLAPGSRSRTRCWLG